jgi:hypothetical protein
LPKNPAANRAEFENADNRHFHFSRVVSGALGSGGSPARRKPIPLRAVAIATTAERAGARGKNSLSVPNQDHQYLGIALPGGVTVWSALLAGQAGGPAWPARIAIPLAGFVLLWFLVSLNWTRRCGTRNPLSSVA